MNKSFKHKQKLTDLKCGQCRIFINGWESLKWSLMMAKCGTTWWMVGSVSLQTASVASLNGARSSANSCKEAIFQIFNWEIDIDWTCIFTVTLSYFLFATKKCKGNTCKYLRGDGSISSSFLAVIIPSNVLYCLRIETTMSSLVFQRVSTDCASLWPSICLAISVRLACDTSFLAVSSSLLMGLASFDMRNSDPFLRLKKLDKAVFSWWPAHVDRLSLFLFGTL